MLHLAGNGVVARNPCDRETSVSDVRPFARPYSSRPRSVSSRHAGIVGGLSQCSRPSFSSPLHAHYRRRKLEFLTLKEGPFKRAVDTGGPPLFIFLPDKSVSPACNKIECFH